jgi:hypothetical protein
MPTIEPLTVSEAKIRCAIDAEETVFDEMLAGHIVTARAWIERYCGPYAGMSSDRQAIVKVAIEHIVATLFENRNDVVPGTAVEKICYDAYMLIEPELSWRIG